MYNIILCNGTVTNKKNPNRSNSPTVIETSKIIIILLLLPLYTPLTRINSGSLVREKQRTKYDIIITSDSCGTRRVFLFLHG